MFLMVLLTFIVGLITMKNRIASVKSGAVNAKYFKLMEGQEVPEIITKTTRCFNNMFEVPVLFYAGCILYISLGVESLIGLVFAWFFVLMRFIQAYVHLTYNHLIHRMLSFWLAFLCTIGLWVNLLFQQRQQILPSVSAKNRQGVCPLTFFQTDGRKCNYSR